MSADAPSLCTKNDQCRKCTTNEIKTLTLASRPRLHAVSSSRDTTKTNHKKANGYKNANILSKNTIAHVETNAIYHATWQSQKRAVEC